MPQRFKDIITAIRTLPRPRVRDIAQYVGLSPTQTQRLIVQMHQTGIITILSDPGCPYKIKINHS
jgi:hypothetical protein